ncbi:MFS transporter [Deinococcus peraridilitoris]|uniref:Sugar phosphate permease n=1 Tax=Deinococcus peraridilitoris (strain DSM 19664 / LMG 22246 / CIP 109416 / KR-200) TaxID=937777 RepID=K9ZXP1_DEIPD|nr:MFS transporter [Deinococcus peraridilitoris]AFZ66433.1 sugar phosphate permease [Deinococcus peraridilitoris DSM 19664]
MARITQSSRVINASPVYYGWVVVAAGTLGVIMTTPGQTVGVSAFLDSIIADLGLSRSSVSLTYMIGTLLGAFSMPFFGRAIDRFGPRTMVTVIAALLALACVGMAFVTNAVTLLLGFTALRALGQGALGLVSVHVINLWFVRRRGLALGISGVGAALANAVFPSLIAFLIAVVGWRAGYAWLGALVAFTILPVGAWLYRDQPERFGMVPDGHAGKDETQTVVEENFTLAQARRTAMFWLIMGSNVVIAALGTGLIFHHFSILAQGGIGRETAALVFVPIAVVFALTNLAGGLFIDRFSPRALIPVSLLCLTLALLSPLVVASAVTAFIYGALLGVMQGTQSAVASSSWAYYFGRTHLGSIRGFAFTASVAGTALGPLLFALGKDYSGTYTGVLVASAVVPLALAGLALFVRPPKTIDQTA